MPVCSGCEKGDRHAAYGITFDVSSRAWEDLPGQIQDAVAFLEAWGEELAAFRAEHVLEGWCLDFPLISRLEGDIWVQVDPFPARLIELAGHLGMGVTVSTHARNAIDPSR